MPDTDTPVKKTRTRKTVVPSPAEVVSKAVSSSVLPKVSKNVFDELLKQIMESKNTYEALEKEISEVRQLWVKEHKKTTNNFWPSKPNRRQGKEKGMRKLMLMKYECSIGKPRTNLTTS